MAAWEQAKAEYTARTGFKQKGAPTKPRPIPPKERLRINITDPDSRPVKTARGFIQGYTAQAVTTEEQVIVAADVITGGNERHRLGPMARRPQRELEGGGDRREPQSRLGRRRLLERPPDRLSSRQRECRSSSHPMPTPAGHRARSDGAAATSGCESA